MRGTLPIAPGTPGEQPRHSQETPTVVPAILTPPANSTNQEHPRTPRDRALLLSLAALAAFGVATLLCARWWPFRRDAIVINLQEASDSQVQIRTFHRFYFPYPGCVLEGVFFTRRSNAQPVITVERVTLRATYPGILTHHLRTLTAEGLHVFIPAFGTGQPFHTRRSNITIGEIVAHDATVEFASRNADRRPMRFEIHDASLQEVGWKGPLTYRISLHNPEPPGEITATGKFGVWEQQNPAQTPISGEYKFEHADLGVFPGIAGTLSSSGKFAGTLGRIDISGTTDTPDFNVKSSSRHVNLKTQFIAYVDATHGDTFLKRVDGYFQKTHVVAQGSIARSENGKGKTALLDLSTGNGRIEDILGLFVHDGRAPMAGAVTLKAKVTMPPGKRRFLDKVILRGNFGIGGGEFSKPSTQEGVDKLSAGARGEKDSQNPPTVFSDLTGEVTLHNGAAHFSDLSFGVPGATARMHGTYNLISHKIDLRGQMQVDSKLSNTTSGGKAFLLKIMEPFFKKHKKGEILPVKISGTYEEPSFGLDLRDKKAQQVAPPSSAPKGSVAPPHSP